MSVPTARGERAPLEQSRPRGIPNELVASVVVDRSNQEENEPQDNQGERSAREPPEESLFGEEGVIAWPSSRCSLIPIGVGVLGSL